MDKCPSIVILHQTFSDLLRQVFREVHMCYVPTVYNDNVCV